MCYNRQSWALTDTGSSTSGLKTIPETYPKRRGFMFRFSISTLSLLSKAGWSEEYRYDTSDYVTLLQSCGYTVHEAALDFMQRFGGLVITYPHPVVPRITETMRLSVNYGINNIFRGRARMASDLLGSRSMRYRHVSHARLYSSNGCVGRGLWLRRYSPPPGESGEEAIDNICSGNYGEDLT